MSDHWEMKGSTLKKNDTDQWMSHKNTLRKKNINKININDHHPKEQLFVSKMTFKVLWQGKVKHFFPLSIFYTSLIFFIVICQLLSQNALG